MAALVSGWADCGISLTHTLSLDIAMRNQVAGTFPNAWGRIDSVGLYFSTRPASGATPLGCAGLATGDLGVDSWSTVEFVFIDEPTGLFTGGGAITVLGSAAGSCTPTYFPAVTVTKALGPLRLGVTIKEGVLHYAWFSDDATNLVYTVNSVTVRTIPFSDPPARTSYTFRIADSLSSASGVITGQGTMIQFARPVLGLGPGLSGASTNTHVRFSNFSANNGSGAVTTTAPETVEFTALGQPVQEFYRAGGSRFGFPFRLRHDIDCDETSGSAVAADFTVDGSSGTCPDTVDVTKRFWGLIGQVSTENYDTTAEGYIVPAAALADPWLSAQDVTPYADDRTFRFEGNSPLDPTLSSPTDYSAGSVEIDASVSVLQSSTAWATDLGSVAITGTPTVPIFTVSSTPAIVRRPLLSYWREWDTIGDPRYQNDGYKTTKTAYYSDSPTPDVFGTSVYAYLEVDLTVPAGDPSELAIEVTWAVHRGASTIDTITRTYSPVTFPAGGRSTQRVDLMFPTAMVGRPFYGERVDQIRLIGLQMGATTLHALNLIADEDAYFTAMGRRTPLRDGSSVYTGLVLSQDGSAPSLMFGRDTALSPPGDTDLDGWQDYRGDHQNGAFIVNGVTQEHPGHAVGMEQATLEDSLEELDRLEGVAASYSDTALLAALTDGDGNVAGIGSDGVTPTTITRRGDWFLPTLPADRIAPGTPYDVRGQFVFDGVVIPAGCTPSQMRIFQRNHLGMVLEAVAVDSNYERHGAGETVRATAYTGGAPAPGDLVLATETTDASGYVILGVRNGQIDGSEFSATLSS